MRTYQVMPLLRPRPGYDQAAPIYDQWHWTKFWRKNESPIVLDWFRDVPKEGLALDAGSGTGNYVVLLGKMGFNCVSLDLSRQMLRIQQKKLDCLSGIAVCDLLQGDAHALPFPASTFQYIVCTRVLSHCEQPERMFSEFARVVQPGGRMIISDVHPDHPYDHVTISNSIRVAIETCKHSLDVVKRAAATNGLRVDWLKEYSVRDLSWKPQSQQFSKLFDNPQLPIFYVSSLSRP